MKHLISKLLVGLCVLHPQVSLANANQWSKTEIAELRQWIALAPKDALPLLPTNALDAAIRSGDQSAINQEADAAAKKLASMHLTGCCSKAERKGWNIKSGDANLDVSGFLKLAHDTFGIHFFFMAMRPRHPEYLALYQAYTTEKDPLRRKKLARNMERWRWMPLAMGDRHLIVNVPRYEVSLWDNGKKINSWPVIVGKSRTRTPVFDAKVTGVVYNPWWNIPKSIVAESVGALVRRNPAEARRRGYVWSNGRYRQKPGANNALGLMKLVMPNPYSVYLHDTANKALFAEPKRMFSHGCIRVGNALDFAATLVGDSKSPSAIENILVKGKTQTVPLEKPVPVYVAYFTADIGSNGQIAYHDDIYGRDKHMGDSSSSMRPCAG